MCVLLIPILMAILKRVMMSKRNSIDHGKVIMVTMDMKMRTLMEATMVATTTTVGHKSL